MSVQEGMDQHTEHDEVLKSDLEDNARNISYLITSTLEDLIPEKCVADHLREFGPKFNRAAYYSLTVHVEGDAYSPKASLSLKGGSYLELKLDVLAKKGKYATVLTGTCKAWKAPKIIKKIFDSMEDVYAFLFRYGQQLIEAMPEEE